MSHEHRIGSKSHRSDWRPSIVVQSAALTVCFQLVQADVSLRFSGGRRRGRLGDDSPLRCYRGSLWRHHHPGPLHRGRGGRQADGRCRRERVGRRSRIVPGDRTRHRQCKPRRQCPKIAVCLGVGGENSSPIKVVRVDNLVRNVEREFDQCGKLQ